MRHDVATIASRPTCDVLVIGGGINGISITRDLALQGVDVVLVDAGDYCSGASAASSHMIHGGIRYLENGEFRLVRESVIERNRLLRIAPHFVRPLATTIPLFDFWGGLLSAPLRMLRHRVGRPGRRGAFLVTIGLTIYDVFSRDGGQVPRHRIRRRSAALADLPQLNPEVRYTATYFDAAVESPERLAIDVLRDARAAGARTANYLAVVARDGGGVVVRDEDGAAFAVHPTLIINATGPWVDRTNAVLGEPTAYMGGSKGSHIVVDSPELLAACAGRELFFENSDGRIVLVYPLDGRVLIGTTDLDTTDLDDVRCTQDEIDYFLELVALVFPAITIRPEDIVYTFAGVRPLPRHEDLAPGFASRDYRVVERGNELSVVGGKWTTFRALGERLADLALERLGRTRSVSTRDLVIGGGVAYIEPTQDDDESILRRRYGTIARPEGLLDHPLGALSTYGEDELRWLVTNEYVVHLDDLIRRRTSIAFRGEASPGVVKAVARIVGGVLGWDDTTRQSEVDRTLGLCRVAP
jgi:glycerol-3-phosphate dehydrogenase